MGKKYIILDAISLVIFVFIAYLNNFWLELGNNLFFIFFGIYKTEGMTTLNFAIVIISFLIHYKFHCIMKMKYESVNLYN